MTEQQSPRLSNGVKDQVTQDQINNAAWAACDTFRGVVDATQYKDYILVMLFVKYISDVWTEHEEKYQKQFEGNPEQRCAGSNRGGQPGKAGGRFSEH
jgi:type I restriction enzyme M protein